MVQSFLAAWMALLSCGMSILVDGLYGSCLDGKLSQNMLTAGLEKLSMENLTFEKQSHIDMGLGN